MRNPDRRRVPLALTLAAAVVVACGLFSYRTGEVCYRGRPASWWAAAAVRSEPVVLSHGGVDALGGHCRNCPGVGWVAPAWERWLDRAGLVNPVGSAGRMETLLRGDPEAVPVLLELARRPEANARLAAVEALGALADEHPAARPALEAATADRDKRVRLMAKSALGRLEGPRKEDWPDW